MSKRNSDRNSDSDRRPMRETAEVPYDIWDPEMTPNNPMKNERQGDSPRDIAAGLYQIQSMIADNDARAHNASNAARTALELFVPPAIAIQCRGVAGEDRDSFIQCISGGTHKLRVVQANVLKQLAEREREARANSGADDSKSNNNSKPKRRPQ